MKRLCLKVSPVFLWEQTTFKGVFFMKKIF